MSQSPSTISSHLPTYLLPSCNALSPLPDHTHTPEHVPASLSPLPNKFKMFPGVHKLRNQHQTSPLDADELKQILSFLTFPVIQEMLLISGEPLMDMDGRVSL